MSNLISILESIKQNKLKRQRKESHMKHLTEELKSSIGTAIKAHFVYLGTLAFSIITIQGLTDLDVLVDNLIPLPLLKISVHPKQFIIYAPIILFLSSLYFFFQLNKLAEVRKQTVDGKTGKRTPYWTVIDNFIFASKRTPSDSKKKYLFFKAFQWSKVQVLRLFGDFILWYLYPVTISLILLKYLQTNNFEVVGYLLFWTIIAVVVSWDFRNRFYFRSEIRILKKSTKNRRIKLDLYPVIFLILSGFIFITYTGKEPFLLFRGLNETHLVNPNRIYFFHLENSQIGSTKRLDTQNSPFRILTNKSLKGANLRYSNMKFLYLENVDFSSANARGASFEGSILKNCQFDCTVLEGASFAGATLISSDFHNCNLKKVNFDKAVVNKSYFLGSNLQSTSFMHTEFDSEDLPIDLFRNCTSLFDAHFSDCNYTIEEYGKVVYSVPRNYCIETQLKMEFPDLFEYQGEYMPECVKHK